MCPLYTTKLSNGKYLHQCRACKWNLVNHEPTRIRDCGGFKPPEGLGDRAERLLKGMGISQEFYKDIKKKFGLMPTCNCNSRREWLNKVGSKFGYKGYDHGI